MTTSDARTGPSALRRASAVLALTALAAALVFLVVVFIRRWDVLLASVVSLGVAVVAAWYVLSRRGAVRAAAFSPVISCGRNRLMTFPAFLPG